MRAHAEQDFSERKSEILEKVEAFVHESLNKPANDEFSQTSAEL